MHTGMVVTALTHRGFGFIQDDKSGEEIFAHVSDFPNGYEMLPVGTRVSFEVIPFRGRAKACQIQPVAPVYQGASRENEQN